ncbi:MAG TPA: hypothetical protein VGE24_06500 [Emticicia sp.]
MQSEKTQEVTKRFFEILEELAGSGILSSAHDFAKTYQINIGNFFELRKNHSTRKLDIDWLIILVEKYHVSAKYLLTGKGEHFTKKLEIIERPKRKYVKALQSKSPQV